MRDLSLLTWAEINSLYKSRSIVFAVLAPIEEHGRHLPLATDIIEGEHWSKGAMTRLEEKLGIECLYLPSFPVASATVNEFFGSVHFPMKTTYDVAFEVLDSLRSMGFVNIVMIASHADPEHQIAVEKAVRKINRRYGLCAIAPMGQIFMGVSVQRTKKLERFEELHKNDYHAGWIETSAMLDIDPQLVRTGYEELPSQTITDREMISKKRQLAVMGEYGHKFATAEVGKDLNDNCIASVCDAAERFFLRDGYEKYQHYPLYNILPLHIGFAGIFGKVRRKRGNV